jgi:hypothetical protein
MAFTTYVSLGNVPFGVNEPHRYQNIDSHYNESIVMANCRMIKDNTIRMNQSFDTISGYGYGYYTPSGSSKRIYFFVVSFDYVNDSCTDITISVDWFSTDYRHISLANSYIERIHPNDFKDSFPNITEGLSFGEEKYTFQDSKEISYNSTYIIGVTHDIPTELIDGFTYICDVIDGTPFNTVHVTQELCGRVDGCVYYVLDSIEKCMNVYQNAVNFGYSSAVIGIWSVPDEIGKSGYTTKYTLETSDIIKDTLNHMDKFTDEARARVETAIIEWTKTHEVNILNSTNGIIPVTGDALKTSKPTTIDSYTPTYAKCFSNEYIRPCVQVANQVAIFNYELFRDENNIVMNVYLTNTPDVKMYIAPYDYNGTSGYANFNNAISCDMSISGSLTADNTSREVSNLVSNSIFSGLHTLTNTVGSLYDSYQSNVVEGGFDLDKYKQFVSDVGSTKSSLINSAINGGLNIAQQAREIGKTASVLNSGTSNVMLPILPTSERNIHVGYVSYRADDIKRLDSYFSHYGYRFDKFGVPNLRSTYTFIKGDINFTGDISTVSRAYIKNLFSNGLTIWNDTAMYTYDVDN